ncbi:MAG TPA: NADH-quinone oxidoreductase subunit L [Verrucomicrobiae bacterium]|nr:NADH-quinone oxidoreductase subunit L [Verrucomicrobiae bacterium]
MQLQFLPWIILFLPLLAAVVITLFTQQDRKTSATLSVSAVVIGFILSVVFIGVNGFEPALKEVSLRWLEIGALKADFGLRLDPLSLMMLLVVTGVGSAIHIYSWGYMHEDRCFSRFFASLSLFTFSMLGIVLANNFLQMFISWELVGVSSYLLIGFWYEKASAADAAKKAFITNRLGDFGFMLGILTVWVTLGSLNFGELQTRLTENPAAFGALATTAGLLIFCGAIGKSAQFPLHVWLPDAMEGPTPVSALIHAATMVAAGVYMLSRVFFVFTPDALHVIAWIGGFTSLLAALIAVQQDDIKRILAYSTLSQLGYMVMAVGVQAPAAGMFHLTTHAFFKALLFLGAGSVIHALHHEQNIWKIGGLRKKMPVTFWTFMVGTLALAGVWPMSGFFSKDAILAAAKQESLPLYLTGVGVAALTTFYMFRLVFVAFLGSERTPEAGHAHESPWVMTWPLRILAAASVVGGVIGIEHLFGGALSPEHSEEAQGVLAQLVYPFHHAFGVAIGGLAAVAVGFFAAYALYAKAKEDPLPAKLGALSRWMRNRFYFDELYEATVIKVHDTVAAVTDWFDRWLIGFAAVRGTAGATDLFGRALRLVQNGNLQTYTFLLVLGVAVILFFVLGR